MHIFTRLCALAICLGAALPAAGVDVNSNLSPLEVQDAEPADAGSRSLDVRGRFQHTDEGKREWLLQPQLKLGLSRNMQLDLGTAIVGGQEREGRGDLSARLLYRIREEGRDDGLPAIALSLRADFPTGVDSAGVDTDARLIMSRKLSSNGHGYANLAWMHDASARRSRREHRYGLILGYAHSLSPRTNLVSDLVVRQKQSPGEMESIVEFGVRHALRKDTVLGAALGWGANDDAPRYRLLFSVQQGF